jgi:adenylate cyclase
LFQILVVSLFWVLCGILLAIYKCVTYDQIAEKFVFLVPWELPLGQYILINMLGPLIGGLFGGAVVVFYLNQKLRRKSYLRYQLVSTGLFFLVILSLNCAISFLFYYQQAILTSETPLNEALRLLFDPYAVRNILTWMIIAFFTLHGLRVSEKYGPGTYFRLFIGKFHKPREVERIFMFLDLTDATTIAEQLGHRRFFGLLQEFYADMTDPILNSRGHIYQYVGDEISVSWPVSDKRPGNFRFLQCFFDIEQVIFSKASKYLEKYGFVPVFKAALHSGTVVVGEMGVVKREIVYSGDILNTTARILEQCKRHEEKLIISQDVLDKSASGIGEQFRLRPLGNLILRGKKRPISLFGVEKITDALHLSGIKKPELPLAGLHARV